MTTSIATPSLEQRELQARIKYADINKEVGALISKAQDTITSIVTLALPGPLPRSKEVCTNLLVRISNELRAVRLLCDVGYSLQAFSPAAAAYEAAYTIACVADDQKEAEKWWTHADEQRSYDNVAQLTQRGLKNLGYPDDAFQARFERDYAGNYRDLCMAKHSNPIFQKSQGVRIEPDQTVFIFGPDLTDHGEYKSLWVQNTAVMFVYPALFTYLSYHVPKSKFDTSYEEYQKLEIEHLAVNCAVRSRLADLL